MRPPQIGTNKLTGQARSWSFWSTIWSFSSGIALCLPSRYVLNSLGFGSEQFGIFSIQPFGVCPINRFRCFGKLLKKSCAESFQRHSKNFGVARRDDDWETCVQLFQIVKNLNEFLSFASIEIDSPTKKVAEFRSRYICQRCQIGTTEIQFFRTLIQVFVFHKIIVYYHLSLERHLRQNHVHEPEG